MKRMKGYATLIITLIIAFILMAVVLSFSAATLSKLPMLTKTQLSNESKSILLSCVEESLLMLNNTGDIVGQIIINGDACNFNLISNIDPNWEYDVNISKNSYIYSARVKARRLDKVYLDSLIYIDE